MTPAGLLHSEICGSKPTYGSPQLIAVNRVLLRLLVPRHSPCALCSLTICVLALNKLSLITLLKLQFYLNKTLKDLSLNKTLDFCLLSLYSVFKELLLTLARLSPHQVTEFNFAHFVRLSSKLLCNPQKLLNSCLNPLR